MIIGTSAFPRPHVSVTLYLFLGYFRLFLGGVDITFLKITVTKRLRVGPLSAIKTSDFSKPRSPFKKPTTFYGRKRTDATFAKPSFLPPFVSKRRSLPQSAPAKTALRVRLITASRSDGCFLAPQKPPSFPVAGRNTKTVI